MARWGTLAALLAVVSCAAEPVPGSAVTQAAASPAVFESAPMPVC